MSPVKFSGLILAVLGGLLIAACSTTGRSYVESSLQETLEIEIMPNTSKMFVYRLRSPEDQMQNNVRISRGASGRGEGGMFGNGDSRGGVDVSRSSQQRLHENAAYVVEHMGYCREGFLEIDSSISRYHLWMKGECKEGATEDDRKKFGAKQTIPVKFAQ